ncbi:hypothetical protein ATN38_00490 [Rhodococcus sp. FH8]|nr:hypothetical protein [Rhodococcus sp. FH8]
MVPTSNAAVSKACGHRVADQRLDRASRLGANRTLAPSDTLGDDVADALGGRKPDVVIEAVSSRLMIAVLMSVSYFLRCGFDPVIRKIGEPLGAAGMAVMLVRHGLLQGHGHPQLLQRLDC